MPDSFRLREAVTGDGAALAELIDASPDGGRVAIAPRFHVPVMEAVRIRHPGALGVVAELPGRPGLIGAAWSQPGRCRLGEVEVPSLLLNSLVVHPDFRRRGLAAAMTRWRLDRIDDPPNTLVLATIQAGNVASLANARKWSDTTSAPIRVAPVPMRRRPPRIRPELSVREVRDDELAALADGMNAYYADHEFHREQDVDSLRSWLDQQAPRTTAVLPAGSLNHWVVAVDRSGRLLAGVGLQEEARLTSLMVTAMPRAVRLANLAARVVPADGEMRNLNATMPWFAAGELSAGRHLWQRVRWDFRDRGTAVLTAIDPREPVAEMIRTPFWVPSTSLTIAMRGPRALDPGRLLAAPG